MGYFWRQVLSGSKGRILGLSVRQYCKKQNNKKHREETISPLFSTLNRKCGIAE